MRVQAAGLAEALTILDDLCRECWELHNGTTTDVPREIYFRDRREIFARCFERINALKPSSNIIVVRKLYTFPPGAGYRHRLKIARKLLLRLNYNIMTWTEEGKTP